MIKSFRSKDTEALFRLEHVRRWAPIERVALRKPVQLNLAASLSDMRAPPGNRLEALSGNRKGQWSIRINDQFESVSAGAQKGRKMLKLLTITEGILP